MSDFAARLEGTGEFVDAQALSPEGTFVRCGGVGRPGGATWPHRSEAPRTG